MGIAFAFAGIILIVTGAQNTYGALGAQLTKDFTGQGNFTYWFGALILVGMLGYITALKNFSTWFMALVLLALFLSKGKGFFTQLSTALAKGPVAPSSPAPSSAASSGSTLPSLSGQGMSGDVSALTGFLLNPGGTPQ